MAAVFDQQYKGSHYRVVQAGNAIRLYRNNVLHSQWNNRRPIAGKLWDLFLLSVLGLNHSVSRVLVLGAGGGSVINLIHYFFPTAEIDALDYDAMHLKIAKKYFKVNLKKCRLLHSDAEQWLQTKKDTKYDLIIDDIFTEVNNIPFRSVINNKQWIQLLFKHLNKNGVIVINFADKQEWKNTVELCKSYLQNKYICVAHHQACENHIIHISKQNISMGKIKPNLLEHSHFMKYIHDKTISYRAVNLARK